MSSGKQSGPVGERRPVGVIALHRAEIGQLDFEAAAEIHLVGLDDAGGRDFPAPTPCRRAPPKTPACRWRSGRARSRGSPRSRAASRTSRRSWRGRRAARRVRRCRPRSRSRPGCGHFGCILPARAEHLVQRQHRVVGGVIGVVAGRAVDHLAAVAHGEVIGDRDRLVVGDEEAVLRARRRAPGAHAGVGAGLQQIDRRAAAVGRGVRPLSGIHFSCVPQPSSAGCMPSDTKPSTDQVLTNTFIGFGLLGALGVALGDMDALDAELAGEPAPAFARLFGSSNRRAWCRGRCRAAPA